MSAVQSGTDYTGRKFGHMTAVSPTLKRDQWGARIWVLNCVCGNEVKASPAYLKSKNANCGCLKGTQPDHSRAVELARKWLAKPIVGVRYESLNEAELELAITGQTYNELCDQLGITDAETLKLADRYDWYVSIEDGAMQELEP